MTYGVLNATVLCMSRYDTFQFKTDLPKALLPSGEDFIVENSYYGKSGAVVRVAEDNTVTLVSVHDRMDLASRRARAEERSLPKESTDEVLSVEIKRVPRYTTYFDEDGAYGDAKEILVLDTSTWTPQMWQRLQWVGAFRRRLAIHFDSKKHEFEEFTYNSYAGGVVTPTTMNRCKECTMVESNLNL